MNILYVIVVCANSGSWCHYRDAFGDILTMPTQEYCESRVRQFYSGPGMSVHAYCKAYEAPPGQQANDQ